MRSNVWQITELWGAKWVVGVQVQSVVGAMRGSHNRVEAAVCLYARMVDKENLWLVLYALRVRPSHLSLLLTDPMCICPPFPLKQKQMTRKILVTIAISWFLALKVQKFWEKLQSRVHTWSPLPETPISRCSCCTAPRHHCCHLSSLVTLPCRLGPCCVHPVSTLCRHQPWFGGQTPPGSTSPPWLVVAPIQATQGDSPAGSGAE